MEIGNATLNSLRDHIAGAGDPIAGGVAVSAVSAALAFSILAMTLEVTSRRKDFSGDRAGLLELARQARNRGDRMAQYADEDAAAYQGYRDAVRQRRDPETALQKIIETPLGAAVCAADGLDLCAQALPLATRSVLPDLGAAATLLAAAVKAILLSVDVNLGRLPAESKFGQSARRTWQELEARAGEPAERLMEQVRLRWRT